MSEKEIDRDIITPTSKVLSHFDIGPYSDTERFDAFFEEFVMSDLIPKRSMSFSKIKHTMMNVYSSECIHIIETSIIGKIQTMSRSGARNKVKEFIGIVCDKDESMDQGQQSFVSRRNVRRSSNRPHCNRGCLNFCFFFETKKRFTWKRLTRARVLSSSHRLLFRHSFRVEHIRMMETKSTTRFVVAVDSEIERKTCASRRDNKTIDVVVLNQNRQCTHSILFHVFVDIRLSDAKNTTRKSCFERHFHFRNYK